MLSVSISEINTVNWTVTISLDKRKYIRKLVIVEKSIEPTELQLSRASTELMLTCELETSEPFQVH